MGMLECGCDRSRQSEMSNPLRILRALDEFLHAPFQLYVYGRSALALGYPNAPAAYHATMDVDAILPARDVRAIEANEDFWQAQEQVDLRRPVP